MLTATAKCKQQHFWGTLLFNLVLQEKVMKYDFEDFCCKWNFWFQTCSLVDKCKWLSGVKLHSFVANQAIIFGQEARG